MVLGVSCPGQALGFEGVELFLRALAAGGAVAVSVAHLECFRELELHGLLRLCFVAVQALEHEGLVLVPAERAVSIRVELDEARAFDQRLCHPELLVHELEAGGESGVERVYLLGVAAARPV